MNVVVFALKNTDNGLFPLQVQIHVKMPEEIT